MIYYIALENLEERYTKMMNLALTPLVDKVIYPKVDFSEDISTGQFLDINKTIIFKAKQVEMIAELFMDNKIKDGDIFLIGDIFFPGIEAIRYMSELQGIRVTIGAFNYAGRADRTDFVQKLGSWSDSIELGYHQLCDVIFVGSEFHQKAVLDKFNIPEYKVIMTGLVWDLSYVKNLVKPQKKKEDFVIFPHRITPEKGLEDLKKYAKLSKKRIVVTSSHKTVPSVYLPSNVEFKVGLTKKEYYQILSKAKYYLTTAQQETFGYTLQEAIFFGAEIAAPARACYPEMLPVENIYTSIEDIDSTYAKVPKSYTEMWDGNASNIIDYLVRAA